MKLSSVKSRKIVSRQTGRMTSLALSLSKISAEFLIDQNRFLPDLSYIFSQYLITWFLTAVRHKVNNLEMSVVVQELDLAINIALYVFMELR